MKKSLSKSEVKNQIDEFFKNVKLKSPKEIKKIKKLAMAYNISLKEKRKLFCKRCLVPYNNPKTRIKNNKKMMFCKECGEISRWKIK